MKKLLFSCILISSTTQLRTETIAHKIENNVETAAEQVHSIWKNGRSYA